jgi:hypothetical protein
VFLTSQTIDFLTSQAIVFLTSQTVVFLTSQTIVFLTSQTIVFLTSQTIVFLTSQTFVFLNSQTIVHLTLLCKKSMLKSLFLHVGPWTFDKIPYLCTNKRMEAQIIHCCNASCCIVWFTGVFEAMVSMKS